VQEKKAYIIVLGNEKGGTGKSTTAMHITAALLTLGYKVGCIDVDARQATFTRYIDNRRAYVAKNNLPITVPDVISLQRSALKDRKEAEDDDKANLDNAVHKLKGCDFIVIDTAGNDTFLSRYAHSYADTLITPLNDSMIDLDVIAHVDPETYEMTRPSVYAEWVWEQKQQRAARQQAAMDWIILRNRLTNIHSKNKERIEAMLQKLSKRLAFRQIPGFSERVIFRELFHQGLTLLDLQAAGQSLNLSHVAAKQELRNLIEAIRLPALQEKVAAAF